MVQNRKQTDTDTANDDDDDDEGETPESTGRPIYDFSERNGKYAPMQTNPEDDTIQNTHRWRNIVENTVNIVQGSN